MEENKNFEQQAQPVEQSNVTAEPKVEVAKKPQGKKKSMTFGKVFLAALLAVVAGSVVTFVFWVSLFSGISAAFQPATKSVPETAILKINLAEDILDAFLEHDFEGGRHAVRVGMMMDIENKN